MSLRLGLVLPQQRSASAVFKGDRQPVDTLLYILSADQSFFLRWSSRSEILNIIVGFERRCFFRIYTLSCLFHDVEDDEQPAWTDVDFLELSEGSKHVILVQSLRRGRDLYLEDFSDLCPDW
jgi:hypothetical protein